MVGGGVVGRLDVALLCGWEVGWWCGVEVYVKDLVVDVVPLGLQGLQQLVQLVQLPGVVGVQESTFKNIVLNKSCSNLFKP